MLASAQSRVALAAFVLAAAGHRSSPLGAPLPSAASWPGLGTGHWAAGTGRLCAWAVWTAQYQLWPLQGWILQVRTQKGGRQSGIAHAEIWGSGFPYVPPLRFQALGRLPCNIGSVSTTTRPNCFLSLDACRALPSDSKIAEIQVVCKELTILRRLAAIN